MSVEELYERAEQLRLTFEQGSVDKDELVRLYRDYNPKISDVAGFIDAALDIFPLGNCGIASLALRESIGGLIVNGSYDSEGHTFLATGESIVDITADQFGGPRIYVGPHVRPWAL